MPRTTGGYGVAYLRVRPWRGCYSRGCRAFLQAQQKFRRGRSHLDPNGRNLVRRQSKPRDGHAPSDTASLGDRVGAIVVLRTLWIIAMTLSNLVAVGFAGSGRGAPHSNSGLRHERIASSAKRRRFAEAPQSRPCHSRVRPEYDRYARRASAGAPRFHPAFPTAARQLAPPARVSASPDSRRPA